MIKQKLIETLKTDVDFFPSREFLDEVKVILGSLPAKDPLRKWWGAQLLAHMGGADEGNDVTQSANVGFLKAYGAKPLKFVVLDW